MTFPEQASLGFLIPTANRPIIQRRLTIWQFRIWDVFDKHAIWKKSLNMAGFRASLWVLWKHCCWIPWKYLILSPQTIKLCFILSEIQLTTMMGCGLNRIYISNSSLRQSQIHFMLGILSLLLIFNLFLRFPRHLVESLAGKVLPLVFHPMSHCPKQAGNDGSLYWELYRENITGYVISSTFSIQITALIKPVKIAGKEEPVRWI